MLESMDGEHGWRAWMESMDGEHGLLLMLSEFSTSDLLIVSIALACFLTSKEFKLYLPFSAV